MVVALSLTDTGKESPNANWTSRSASNPANDVVWSSEPPNNKSQTGVEEVGRMWPTLYRHKIERGIKSVRSLILVKGM